MDYLVVIHRAEEGGFRAEVPSLPGCYAQGESVEDVLAEARDAIVSHVQALMEDGQPLPDESLIVSTVRVLEPLAP